MRGSMRRPWAAGSIRLLTSAKPRKDVRRHPGVALRVTRASGSQFARLAEIHLAERRRPYDGNLED
jgi:hypothetical protein